MKIKFLKFALMSFLGLILITCQEDDPLSENQIIFDTNAKTEITSLSLNSSSTIDYLLNLIVIIENLVDEGLLSEGNANALISKINNAIKSIEKGNINAVSGQLNAFINQIEVFIDDGKITEEQGQSLIGIAENAIILSEGSFIDTRDGYEYPVVLIGNQLWMAENLRTIMYSNGDLIGTTTPADLNIRLEVAPKYQWPYAGDENNVDTYGRLYTWNAVTDDRQICPQGWHVPSDAEWTTLEEYLIANGYNFDGTTVGNKIAKSLAANTEWIYYDEPGTPGYDLSTNNASGFSALPGGWRNDTGEFWGIGSYGSWWSSSGVDGYYSAYFRKLLTTNVDLIWFNNNKSNGFSVRCIKD